MRLSWTLSRYLALQLLGSVIAVFGLFAVLIFLGSVAELMRRAAGSEDVSFSVVLAMAFLQLPALTERALPFAVMFGSLWSLIRLNRNHEMDVIRASGVSVWQLLYPGIGLAFLIGVLMAGIYNPVSASFTARFEQLEAKYLSGRDSLLAVSTSGLWLRQADMNGQSVVHALRASHQGTDLQNVIIFLYEGRDKFAGRIDAANARLRDGY